MSEYQSWKELFPAGAGVILWTITDGQVGTAVPRRGGGDPRIDIDIDFLCHCSPQGRG